MEQFGEMRRKRQQWYNPNDEEGFRKEIEEGFARTIPLAMRRPSLSTWCP